MIKFFRRIRQRLLSENNLSKYLIYAIGEILLVVIGILIALQINNWNNKNNERQIIENYFIKIYDEIELSQGDMREFIAFVDTLINQNNRSLEILNLKKPGLIARTKRNFRRIGDCFYC